MDLTELLRLIEDDEDGILTIKTTSASQQNGTDRLIDLFQEINNFVSKNGREPKANKNDLQEFQLYSRLNGIRTNDTNTKEVKKYDKFSLLGSYKKIASLEDIFNDEEIVLLDDEPNSIFNLEHVPKTSPTIPDYIARRKPCKDFDKYDHIFKQCHHDLTTGKRSILPFKNTIIEKDRFFILKGILLYVAEVAATEVINGRANPRLRCLFENGTESDVLLRSLSAELYKDGRLVTEHEDLLLGELGKVTPEDEKAGYIYVARSLSKTPKISSINDLYKIGFSKTPLKERFKNAYRDPTFLMAPVEAVVAFKCYNINPQKLELLLHRFFGKVCLDIDIFDETGTRHTPREWFVVPIDCIERVIHLILIEELDNYHYDVEQRKVFQNERIPKFDIIPSGCQ